MKTKTMRLPPRRVLTTTTRRERDDFDAPAPKPAKLLKPFLSQGSLEKSGAPELDSSNQLLAGYLAHEYLSKGTLFGQPYDPARSQVGPPVRREGVESGKEGKYRSYAEVATLLKGDGAHVEGIVNPTQLAQLLHM